MFFNVELNNGYRQLAVLVHGCGQLQRLERVQ